MKKGEASFFEVAEVLVLLGALFIIVLLAIKRVLP